MLVESASTALPTAPSGPAGAESVSADTPAGSEVNPLVLLGERAEAEHVAVHVYKVAKDRVVIEEGEPAGFLHPLSWTTPRPTPPESPTHSSALPNGHLITPEHPPHDSSEKQSRTDQLRIAKQELRQDLSSYKIRSHSTSSKGKERAEPEMEELSRANFTAAANSIPQQNGDPIPQSPLSLQATPPATPPKDPSSQLPEKSNTPGFTASNSRSLSTAPPASPSRAVAPSSVKPLPIFYAEPATASTSSLFPPSLRTSHLSSRRASTSGVLPTLQQRTPLLPRTQSYHHSNSIPLQTITPALDEVAMSIQAQEDIIRKDRQSKRLLKEKSRVEGENAAEPSPKIRRRSTRAGSSTEGPALGTGVLMGNLIGQDHANYVLMYNMLTGIRIGVRSLYPLWSLQLTLVSIVQVSRCQAKARRPLTNEDYTARHKFSFDMCVAVLAR